MKNRLKNWYNVIRRRLSIVIFMLFVIFIVALIVFITVDESLKPKCSETYNIGYWVEDGVGGFRMTQDETAKYCPELVK